MSIEQSEREHSFGWQDPAPALAAGAGLSGLETMQAISRGDIPRPPVAELMDFSIPFVDTGVCVFATTTAEWMMNPIGSVHGGMIATMLDSCVGCAVHTTLPPNVGYTTLELKVNYVRALGAGVAVRAEGNVIHAGSKVATAEGKLVEADSGKLIAHATTTCLIMRQE
jgi:uncharacterized protein (TIGR00369 family)